MRGILYAFIALTGTIAVIVFMTTDTLSYKTYKEDGHEIARLLEVVEEDDGTKTARILDFSRVLYAEEHFTTLRKIVSFYQLDADNIELYHRNRYKRRYTAKKAVYRFRLVRTIRRKDLYQEQ